MTDSRSPPPISVGDIDGLGRVYAETGSLVTNSSEKVITTRSGCDLHVSESWRSLFVRTLFAVAPGKLAGRLHLTDRRMVLIRDIDVWKEVKPLLTPLGFPAAAEKHSRLKEIKARGARQYCEIDLATVSISHAREKSTMLFLYITGSNGQKYRVIVYTDLADSRFFSNIKAVLRTKS